MGSVVRLLDAQTTNGVGQVVAFPVGTPGPTRVRGTIVFDPDSVFGTAEVVVEIRLTTDGDWTQVEGLAMTEPRAVPFDVDCEQLRLRVTLADGTTNLTADLGTTAPTVAVP